MDGQCKRRFLWCIWWQGKASLIRWQWSRDFKKRKRSKSHGFLWGQHSRHFSAVQFSHSVVLDFLWPHGLQHTKPPCSSPTPEACSNSRPLSRWCHPTISSYVVSFSSCLQSFPESGSFPGSQFFISGGWSIGVWASASVLFNPDGYLGGEI